MNITSVTDILNGEIINSPFISFVYSFKKNISKVKEGDLFFAKNKNDINEAVSKGAFCIVFEGDDVEIIDDEIAWIKVTNIQKSIYSFVRYKLALKNLNAFYCDDYSFYLLKEQKIENCYLLNESLDKFISNIDDIDDNSIIFSNNKTLLDAIYPNYQVFNKIHIFENFIEHSMFETSFTFNDNYFQRIRVPKLYINSFLDVYSFLKDEFDFNKIKNSDYFKPIFIDKKLKIVEHGKSEKFIICQIENEEINSNEIKFLNKHFSYGKSIYLSKNDNSLLSNSIIQMKNIKDLKVILEKSDFNACYIIGYSYNNIIRELEDTKKELTLF